MKNQFSLISAKLTVFFTIFCLFLGTTAFAGSGERSNDPDSSSRPVEAILNARTEKSSQKTPPDVKEASRQGLEEIMRYGIAEAGDRAPDFILPSLNGKKVTLSSYSDKTVVLWFTNLCSGCQSVLPFVEDISSSYLSQGVSVIAISLLGDDTTTVRQIGRKYTVTFPFLIDPKASVYEKYGGTEIPPGTCPVNPQFFVVNQGIVTYATHLPGAPIDEIRSEIEKAVTLPKPKNSTGAESEHPADQSEHPRDTTER